jgi:choline dehydrogenase-like flavoprotein
LFPFDASRVETVFSRYRARRFGKEYREVLRQAENVTTYLHSNVLSIEKNPESDIVDQVSVGTLQGNRYTVHARYFVLAAGGIENARILLLSHNVQPTGLGNQNDLVGRFFMEHIWYSSGYIIPTDQSSAFDVYGWQHHLEDGVEVRAHVALPEDVIRKERMPDFRAEISVSQFSTGSSPKSSPWSRAASCLSNKDRALQCMERLGAYIVDMLAEMGWRTGRPSQGGLLRYRLNNFVEQIPNPDSRVTLSDDKDAFGLRSVRLDWRLSSIDKYGIRRAHELLALEVGRSGFGRLLFELPEAEEEILHGAGGGSHHMGTTRMSNHPQTGVVDANCCVHGLHNLYVAGSSVFPTGGASNPTLTIVALSLRLADHLKAKFRA